MHTPVLLKEVVDYFAPLPGQFFVDATFGAGGHTEEILKRTAPSGRVLGIEIEKQILDSKSVQEKREKYGERLILENDSYINLKDILLKHNVYQIHGILFDLGMSSWHIDQSGKGFSFQKQEPLDMRFGDSKTIESAAVILNSWSETDITDLLRTWGEERFALRIARNIVQTRKEKPITKTHELSHLVAEAIPRRFQGRRHPATKTFQALRIVVNSELGNIARVLPDATRVLKRGGRIIVISFHSLEDRIIKNYFRNETHQGTLHIITKRPLTPTDKEIKTNPRARSAKLRVAEKR